MRDMKHLRIIAVAALIAIPNLALAQNGGLEPPETSPNTGAQPMMSPEIVQSMKQMLQSCAMMMQAARSDTGNMPMMQGDMGQMPMMHGHMQGETSEASAAMMAAMATMDTSMMEAMQSSDPDVAFVKGMIPHHQGAIDMANTILRHGNDEQVKAWANQIIAAQEKEIAEMQEWLKAQGEATP
jgi:uncharacterized protein (DUF305 family)